MSQRTSMTFILFLLVGLSNSALGYFGPICGQSYRYDSYGMGLSSAFNNGRNSRSRINDEVCYGAGYAEGLNILEQANSKSWCKGNFARGFAVGVKYELNSRIDDNCFSAGHAAGVAQLQIATREGHASIAGQNCIAAYLAGQNDYYNNVSSTSYSTSENKLANCYQQGFYEAPLNL